MDKVSAIFRCHYPIMTLKNIKRRTLPLNLFSMSLPDNDIEKYQAPNIAA